MSHYKTLVSQVLHYWSRPHEKVCDTPLNLASAWKGADLRQELTWLYVFTPAEIQEIEEAIEHAKSTGKELIELSTQDFPLPQLTSRIDVWREELLNGRAFQVLRGIPVKKWSVAESECFFWCFGLHLGIPGMQNPEGDLLGHVKNMRKGDEHVRLYKTAEKIRYHCDAADIVGLLCINKAKEGGKSIIASSVTIYNELLKQRPDLIEWLYKELYVDAFSEGGKYNYVKVPPCRYADGKLRTFYHSDYFRSVRNYANVPAFHPKEKELLDLYDQIASDPEIYLDMEFEEGDIQLVSNHYVIHARTAYHDYEEEDKKRHLLRLWLSLEHPTSFRLRLLKNLSRVSLVASIVSAVLNYARNKKRLQA